MTSIRLDEPVQKLAASIGPPGLRSLDAVHLASAPSIGDYPAAFVTCDKRLAEAGRNVGLNVVTPLWRHHRTEPGALRPQGSSA